MWSFSNPTMEIVTFHLPGWCMLGVFLLMVFIYLGHEYQDLLSPRDGIHVCTDYTSIYTLIPKSLGGMESEPMLTQRGKIPSTGKILLRGGLNPWLCIKQDSEPNTLPASYSDPPTDGSTVSIHNKETQSQDHSPFDHVLIQERWHDGHCDCPTPSVDDLPNFTVLKHTHRHGHLPCLTMLSLTTLTTVFSLFFFYKYRGKYNQPQRMKGMNRWMPINT